MKMQKPLKNTSFGAAETLKFTNHQETKSKRAHFIKPRIAGSLYSARSTRMYQIYNIYYTSYSFFFFKFFIVL